MGIRLSHFATNRAQISDPAAVRKVLAAFRCSFEGDIEETDNGAFLELLGDDWPSALNRVKRKLRPDTAWEYIETLEREHGEEDFLHFLSALGRHLTTGLTVHAVSYLDDDFPVQACEWHIAPNASEVRVTRFTEPATKEDAA